VWIFTVQGFIAVSQDGDSGQIAVCARRLDHIKALFPDAEITESDGSDYKYRATVAPEQLADMLRQQVERINYPHFADALADHAYYDACQIVADAMRRLQPGQSYPQHLTDELYKPRK